MKKICLIIPSLGPGGMEKVMSELSRYFYEKPRTEVHLILYGKKRDIFFSIPEEITIHKPDFEFSNSSRLLFTLKTFFFLRGKIKSIDPHTLLSFGENWNNLVLLASIGLNYPLYISDRAEPGKKRSLLQEFLRNKLYPCSEGIIVQTNKAKEIYEKKFSISRIEAIGNPFKTTHSDPINQRENIILSVGRLIKTKHFDMLIDIFSKTDHSDWKLVIVGGNSVKQDGMSRLKTTIKEKKVESNVILTGTVSDVHAWYRKSKIFAFTSSSEGFPNVIGEAMAEGLPVVAFDCVAGPSELIDDGENGFLIPLFDSKQFELKLNLLMNNTALQEEMGKNSRKKIETYSIEEIGEKFYKVITESF